MTEFNPRAQLNIIEEMIISTKNEFRENGALFLLWGWLVFIASLLHYWLMQINYEHPYIAWFLMPAGAVITIFLVRKEAKETRVKTWIDKMMAYVWISFSACLLIVLGLGFKLQEFTFPLVLMVYGIGTFLSGGILDFRPLILGGIFCWLLAVLSFFIGFEFQLLTLALAVLAAYIIPGYLLKKKFNNV